MEACETVGVELGSIWGGGNNGGEGATQASLPGVVGAVLRVDVEFFTLQHTSTNVLTC